MSAYYLNQLIEAEAKLKALRSGFNRLGPTTIAENNKRKEAVKLIAKIRDLKDCLNPTPFKDIATL